MINENEILVPADHLEHPEDRLGFNIFVKALYCMFRVDEGIVIDHKDKKYILHKFIDGDSGANLIGIQDCTNHDDIRDIPHGTMMWLDLDKPENERHKDNEPNPNINPPKYDIVD